jgi:hypothetical protein
MHFGTVSDDTVPEVAFNLIRVNPAVVLQPLSKKSCDKFLTACYVL